MAGYLANRAFSSINEMKNFLVDDTDEDMLGPFIVPIDSSDFNLFVWRKGSARIADDISTFMANGPGRWIKQPQGGGGSVVVLPLTGLDYWNRIEAFAPLEEWVSNSKDYSLQNWLSGSPGNFVEGSNV